MPHALIIDDEPNIRRMVGALLTAEGFDVRDAADGASGVTAAIQADPDVILLDLMMPGGMDGMATLQVLRTKLPDVPVIMMSGRAGLADAVKAIAEGTASPRPQDTSLGKRYRLPIKREKDEMRRRLRQQRQLADGRLSPQRASEG